MTKGSDILLQQAIGEIKEANRDIARSLSGIKENLKTLNDHNILHTERNNADHADLLEKVMLMTGKYWYLIIGLLLAIFVVMGYQEVLQFFG